MHILHFLLAIASISIHKLAFASTTFECNLYNDYYRGEWLFIDADPDNRKGHAVNTFACSVHSWFYNSNLVKNAKQGIFYFEPNILDEYGRRAVWKIEPIEGNTNEFYIINLYFQEYLCAIEPSSVFKFLYKRRTVYAKSKNTRLNEKCMWSFKQPFSKKDGENNESEFKYTIWNKAFNEPLYASSQIKKGSLRFSESARLRTMFTWKHKPDSDQFNWYVMCKNDDFKQPKVEF